MVEDKLARKLERLHDKHGSYQKVCKAIGLHQCMNASVWALVNDAYVSPAARKRIQRAVFPPPPKTKTQWLVTVEQNERRKALGVTAQEVAEAGLNRLEHRRMVHEQFAAAMDEIKEQMDA